jgi:hypothetical protein
MIARRVSTPCPSCGHSCLYRAVIDISGSNGSAVKGAALECTAPGCGWWEIAPLPARR